MCCSYKLGFKPFTSQGAALGFCGSPPGRAQGLWGVGDCPSQPYLFSYGLLSFEKDAQESLRLFFRVFFPENLCPRWAVDCVCRRSEAQTLWGHHLEPELDKSFNCLYSLFLSTSPPPPAGSGFFYLYPVRPHTCPVFDSGSPNPCQKLVDMFVGQTSISAVPLYTRLP